MTIVHVYAIAAALAPEAGSNMVLLTGTTARHRTSRRAKSAKIQWAASSVPARNDCSASSSLNCKVIGLISTMVSALRAETLREKARHATRDDLRLLRVGVSLDGDLLVCVSHTHLSRVSFSLLLA